MNVGSLFRSKHTWTRREVSDGWSGSANEKTSNAGANEVFGICTGQVVKAPYFAIRLKRLKTLLQKEDISSMKIRYFLQRNNAESTAS